MKVFVESELFILSALILISIVMSLVSIVKASRLKRMLKAMQMDKRLDGVENKISQLLKENPAAASELRAITGIGVEKYDAFEGITGSYSFSAALINGCGDGIIITTLYGHESCSTYLKEIKGGNCDCKLSPEEIKALNKAGVPGKEVTENEGK